MRYYFLAPEVAGGLGERTVMSRERHPPIVSRLHYEMDVWLGDELLEGFPCFIVTATLAREIEAADLSGATLEAAEVTTSEQFRELEGDREIPQFVWLRVGGTAGHDDFGTDATGRLVVSQQARDVLGRGKLEHCEVADFTA